MMRTLDTTIEHMSDKEKYKSIINGMNLQSDVARLKIEAGKRGGRPSALALNKLKHMYNDNPDRVQPAVSNLMIRLPQYS